MLTLMALTLLAQPYTPANPEWNKPVDPFRLRHHYPDKKLLRIPWERNLKPSGGGAHGVDRIRAFRSKAERFKAARWRKDLGAATRSGG